MSTKKHDFLVELGTEELPPTALLGLSEAFAQHLQDSLLKLDLSFNSVHAFATPRRLALRVQGLAQKTPTKAVSIWGPPAKIAFDAQGQPTKAAQAFAQKNGIEVSELETANDGKVDKLLYRAQAGGEASAQLLPELIGQALAALPINKRMRWGASREEFVRPVHWLVMLLDDAVLPCSLFGLPAGRETRGHRFHCPAPIEIARPADYQQQLLEQGQVLVDFSERREHIHQQVTELGESLGGHAVIDADLLDEVTALVEWPVALAGAFDAGFLSVPSEALISSMKEHQKYFHVVDAQGQLLPQFITVANIISDDPAQVITGNEKVIRPRLSDAEFFFRTDKKTPLVDQREKLRTVVFQAKLGSIYDKTERVAQLAEHIAQLLGEDGALAQRAGALSKADLVTQMVYEFADMQGIAGYYYALNDAEPEAVAQALKEQYQPRFAKDALPASATGTILALADRLDTLAGIFGLGQVPTGSKDPFALRRASLAVLRLMMEKQLNLDLRELLVKAVSLYPELPKGSASVDLALNYVLERLRAWYEEAGVPVAVYQAVNAKQLTVPIDINQRVYAVSAFASLPEAQALAAANKRVSNILAKQEGAIAAAVNTELLQEPAEQQLHSALSAAQSEVKPLLARGGYREALTALAALRVPVDAFFDQVMVMTDDAALRDNRLALLQQLREIFLQVADISQLAVNQ